VASSISVVLVAAPQVPILIAEGYPPYVLSDFGAGYLHVAGGQARLERQTPRPMTPRLAELFAAGKGRALLVLQDGKVTLEHYAPPHGMETRFNSYSLVKSLVGALVLKAVAEGKVRDLEQPISELLPASAATDAGKVTVRQALDMTSGIDFEPTPLKQMSGVGEKPFEAVPYNPLGPLAKLHALGLDAVLPSLRVSATEKGVFRYQNVNTALLGAMLEEIYQASLADLLSEKIWRPAGAAEAHWRSYPASGRTTPYCCLYSTAADWALVGRYLMRNGSDSGPFLPEELWRYWIGADIPDAARVHGVYRTQMRYDVLDRTGETLAGPFAYFLGQDGQVVYLKSDSDLVVVRFGEGAQLLHSTLYESVK
jgi:CubicO group peptidase (beta-lactamase class C family)